MKKFITRVELHGVSYDASTYTALHKAMELKGFSRTITSNTGKIYQLLTAEYYFAGDIADNILGDIVEQAVRTVSNNFSYFISNYKSTVWKYLKEIK